MSVEILKQKVIELKTELATIPKNKNAHLKISHRIEGIRMAIMLKDPHLIEQVIDQCNIDIAPLDKETNNCKRVKAIKAGLVLSLNLLKEDDV